MTKNVKWSPWVNFRENAYISTIFYRVHGVRGVFRMYGVYNMFRVYGVFHVFNMQRIKSGLEAARLGLSF